MKRIVSVLALLALGASPALAHVGHGATDAFTAGIAHPLNGLDHMAVMVAVGLWAALKGGRALWAWPAAFVGAFALLHGHAHGSEVAETLSGAEYMAGFALATATLHLIGIGFALTMARVAMRPVIRIAGVACVALGAGLISGAI